MWHQLKDENTLMLHVTMMTVISFSMKYLKSSYASFEILNYMERLGEAYLRYSLIDGTWTRRSCVTLGQHSQQIPQLFRRVSCEVYVCQVIEPVDSSL